MLRIALSILALVILIASATAIDRLIRSACEQGVFDQIDDAILPHLMSPAERESVPRELIASNAGLCPQQKSHLGQREDY